jgi:hypothetical protein
MQTDISQTGRSQQRVTHGMNKNIRVRVSKETFFKRNGNAAQNKFSSFDQPMNVISRADAHLPPQYPVKTDLKNVHISYNESHNNIKFVRQ